MSDLIDRQKVIDALDVLCQEHRYKIPGKRETYSQYNEAWQDALDRAEGAIFNLPPAHPELNEWCHDCKEYDAEKGCCPRWGQVIRTALADAQPERWIPCSERLPEIGQSVLLSVGGMYSAEGCLREDGDWAQFRWDAIQRKDMVGAWKPLPEPYKGEQE